MDSLTDVVAGVTLILSFFAGFFVGVDGRQTGNSNPRGKLTAAVG